MNLPAGAWVNQVAKYVGVALLLAMSAAALGLPPGFVHTTVPIASGNFDSPAGMFELTDGRIVVMQKNGRFFRFDPAQQPAPLATYLHITDIDVGGERGSTNVVLDPSFAQNGYFYVYYTHKSTNRNRVSRFTHSGGTAALSSEFLVWQDNENWSDCCHYGGGLAFGPDGKLYITTGEEFDGPQAQNLARAGGKIIRINKDGTIPADNPFVDGAGGNLDEIWAYGLRNPFRAHWDLVANRLYIGEVGGNVQETAREDLHVGRAGANYGWPNCEGTCGNPAWDDPVYDYGHTAATPAGGAIVAGLTYYGSQFPSTYTGKFFFADYAQGWIKYLTFNPNGSVAAVTDFASGNLGAPVFLMQSQAGTLYYVNILGTVGRITYNAGNQAPVIQSATGTPTSGAAPLNVSFTASATDPEQSALTYHWLFGDGAEADGASVSHAYTQNGPYNAYVQVSDGQLSTLSAPVAIRVGNPPVVTINTPLNGALFQAGNNVAFSGTAVDPDETIPAANYRWDIDFIHNAHTHPTLAGYVGQSGSLAINSSGHDYHDTTGYRLTLQVTDSDGLIGTNTVSVYPQKVNLNLATVPAGLPVLLDGVQLSTPIAYDTMVGFQHVVSVNTNTCVGSTGYTFSGWSDGGAQTHQVTIPATNVSLVANFTQTGGCSTPPASGLVLRLESDSGVVSNNGQVSAWNDQSGSGLNLTASGEPLLVPNALNGRAAVDFDGVNDRLTRTTPLAALPIGNANREVYAVLNYRGAGYGGISYGTPANNSVFGLAVTPTGRLMVQGWGGSNDFASTVAGTGAGWMLQSATLNNGVLSHFQNGNLIATANHTFNTANNQFFMGAEIDSAPHVNMQVAAVLVYNRTLTAAERDAVYAYLNGKYFNQAPNQAPVANADSASIAVGATATLSVLGNDQDSDGTLNPASVLIAQAPTAGVATVNANGTIQYQHTGSSAGTDTFTYNVADDDGLRSNTATVTVTITSPTTPLPTAGLVLRLEADAGIESTEGIITAWRDQSGLSNDLTYGGDPNLVAGSPNGMPVVDFDASGDKLQRVNGLNGMPTGAANRTVILLANYRGAGYGGFAWGQAANNQVFGTLVDPQGRLMIQAWGPTYDAISTTPGTGAGWLVQTAVLQSNQLSHYKDTQLIGSRMQTYATGNSLIVLGAEIDSNPYTNMQVAAVLVYNRALTAQERIDAYSYLVAKFITTGSNQPPVANPDSASIAHSGSGVINVLANDSDPEGALNPGSVAIVTPPTAGSVTVNTGTGAITYTHNGSAATSDSFTYRVADTAGAFSAAVQVSVSITGEAPPISPQDCLQQNPNATAEECVITFFDGTSLGSTYPWFSTSGASDPTQIFKVENGLIHVSGNGLGALISNQRYHDYVMVLEFKWGTQTWGPRAGKAKDAGLFLHSNGVEGGFDDTWMPGLQVQVGDGMMGDFLVMEGVDAQGTVVPMALNSTTDQVTCTYNNWNCRGGYRWKANGVSRLFDQPLGTVHWTDWDKDWQDVIGFRGDNDPDSPDGEWNQMVVIANGSSVDVYVNGIRVNAATQVSPSSGKIQLEVEWAEYYVRRWEMWPLQDAPTPIRPLSIVTSTLPPATPGSAYSYALQTIGGQGTRNFAITSGQLPAGLSLNAGTGVISGTTLATGSYSLTFAVIDAAGFPDYQNLTLTVPAATAALPTTGLVLRLEADSGVESSAGLVMAWRDQTANHNDLSFAGDPALLATGSPGGKPVIDFDGSGDKLQRVGGVTGLPTGAANRTVIMLANYRGVGDGGFAYGQVATNKVFGTVVNPQGLLKVQAWGTTYDAASTTPGSGWLVQTAVLQNNQLSHYKDTQLIGSRTQTYATGNSQIVLGAEIDSDPYVNMQVAAVLVYNRALTAQERTDAYNYLQSKYLTASANQPPLANPDTATVIRGSNVVVSVLANDSDPEGALNPGSVQIVTQPASGVVAVNTATGAITYTNGGGAATSDTFTYRVADAQGVYSAAAQVSVTVTAPDASVTITAPLAGAVVTGSSVTVTYTLGGSGYNHLHLTLDSNTHNTIMDMTGSFTFSNVAPGPHTITAELVDANHNPINTPLSNTSVSFEVQAAGGASLPATGLVLRLEADTGVTTTGTQVTAWADQSTSANHLTATGNPQRIAGALNGKPVIDLDGNGDKLARTAALTALPAGNTNRTLIVLANYRSVGDGGVSYGKVALNNVFGTIVNPQGLLKVQGWGTTNDFVSTVAGTGAGWMIQSAVLNNSQLAHYRDGALIDSRSHTYNTVVNQLLIGAEIDSSPSVSMQVAAVLLYNRALSSAELNQAVAYLQQKYLPGASGNQAPVASADSGSVARSGSVSLNVLANDTDPDGTLDPTSVLIAQNPAHATLVVNAQTGAILYQHDGTAATTDSFGYTVKDNLSAISNSATVSLSILAANQPPVAAADTALATLQGNVLIPVTLNDTDTEGSLNPTTVTVVAQPTQGAVTNNGDGTLRYTHTGGATGTDSFTYTVRDVEGNTSASTTVTVNIVSAVPASGLVLWLEGVAGAISGSGSVATWLDQSAQANHLSAGGAPQWLTNAVKGLPAIDLDGVSAKLQRTAVLSGFPLGATNRSIYVVANYRSNGYGGFSYGTATCNGLFGAIVNPAGKLMVQGWCSDYPSTTTGVGTGWLLQSVTLTSDVMRHYRNGTLIDQQTHAFNTQAGSLVLGAEIDNSPFVSMQVAAVLVFNRALSAAEHQAVTTYLYNKYVAP